MVLFHFLCTSIMLCSHQSKHMRSIMNTARECYAHDTAQLSSLVTYDFSFASSDLKASQDRHSLCSCARRGTTMLVPSPCGPAYPSCAHASSRATTPRRRSRRRLYVGHRSSYVPASLSATDGSRRFDHHIPLVHQIVLPWHSHPRM